MNSAKSNILLYQTWFLALLIYQIYIKTVYYLHLTIKILKSTAKTEANDIVRFQEIIKELPKVPAHIAVAFQYRGPIATSYNDESSIDGNKEIIESVSGDVLNLNGVANVASWLSFAKGVSVISLYDYYGVLKSHRSELQKLVEDQISHLRSIRIENEKQFDFFNDNDVKVVIHCVDSFEGCCDYKNGDDDQHCIHIFLHSRNDGKPKIVDIARDIYYEKKAKMIEDNVTKEAVVDISMMSSKLDFIGNHKTKINFGKEKASTQISEPDLLINLGEIRSTLDFLPWHIKFTELHWLPQVNHLKIGDLLGSFLKFAKCEQRFGK